MSASTEPAAAQPTTPVNTPKNKGLQARRHNEQLKLAAAALDRISTVVLGGAVLAPIFRHDIPGWWEGVGWGLTATLLHGTAQYLLTLLREEK